FGICPSAHTANVDLRVAFAIGQSAPGVPGGIFASAMFESGEGITLNASGQTAFAANLQPGGDITTANATGIWFGRPGEIQLMAREGGPTGLGDGIIFTQGFFKRDVSDAGHILFDSSIAGPGVSNSNNQVLFLARDGVLSVAVREGDAVPGVPGHVFIRFQAG